MQTVYPLSNTCQIPTLNSIYEKYFGYKTDGIFMEIGGYDGYEFSNTWGLAEAGWRGIYFEPVPEFYAKCVRTHIKNNVSVENMAVWDYDGELSLELGGTLTSASKEHIDVVRLLDWAKGIYTSKWIKSPCITLKSYVKSKYPKLNKIDLLVIDVEGGELNVLRGANLEVWKPTMLIIEAHEHHPDTSLRIFANDINTFVQERGYTKVYSDAINNIYTV